jgi:hypothetical protein
MIIDTQKKAISIQLQKLVFLFILVIFIILLFTTNILINPVFGITREMVAMAAVCLYILGYIFSYLRNINYLYFNNNSSKLIIRYYSLKPLSSEQNSLELNKTDFQKFEMIDKLWGLQKYLIVYQRTSQGIAKYPPISISILKKTDRDKLVRELSRL